MINDKISTSPLPQKAIMITVLILGIFVFTFIDTAKSIFKILFGIAVGIIIFPFLTYSFIRKNH